MTGVSEGALPDVVCRGTRQGADNHHFPSWQEVVLSSGSSRIGLGRRGCWCSQESWHPQEVLRSARSPRLPVRGERGTMKERKKGFKRGKWTFHLLIVCGFCAWTSRVVQAEAEESFTRPEIFTQSTQRDVMQLQIVSQIKSLRNVSWKEWEKGEDATLLIGLGRRAGRPIIGGSVVQSPALTAGGCIFVRVSVNESVEKYIQEGKYNKLHFPNWLEI